MSKRHGAAERDSGRLTRPCCGRTVGTGLASTESIPLPPFGERSRRSASRMSRDRAAGASATLLWQRMRRGAALIAALSVLVAIAFLSGGCGGGEETRPGGEETRPLSAKEKRERAIKGEIDSFTEKDTGDYCYLNRRTQFVQYSTEYQGETLPVNELECRRTRECGGRDGRPSPGPGPQAPRSSPREPLPPGIGCVRFTEESERATERVDRANRRQSRVAARRGARREARQRARIRRGEYQAGDPCPPDGPPPGFTCVPQTSP
jgi:hypothetical protein